MKALAAATAALSVKDAANAAQAIAQNPKAGVGINISIGGSHSESDSTQSSSTAVDSKIAADGNVSIEATGAGSGSSLNVTGSDVLSGGTAALKADGAVNLAAAQNTADQHGTNSGSSGSIGIGINFGSSQNGLSFNAGASQSRGHADGNDVAWTNTHVSGEKVNIASGGDTTLKGAVVTGKQVTADIKGNLTIESLQDTSTYDSKQQSAGASVSVCMPPFCYGASTASANFSNAHANGNYAGVTEQSGILAGDGGFQVAVKSNTDLKGGVIASSDKAIADGRNSLTTATLTTSDIRNHDSHDASGLSVGVSVSGKLGDQSSDAARQNMNDADKKAADNAKSNTGMTPGLGQANGSQANVTKSGISGATIIITDEQGQQAATGKTAGQTVASLNRDVGTDKGAVNVLTKAWDGQQLMSDVQAQMQITAAALPRLAKEFADYAKTQADALRKQGNEAEAKKWDEGGAYRIAGHAVIGALGGGLSGAAGAADCGKHGSGHWRCSGWWRGRHYGTECRCQQSAVASWRLRCRQGVGQEEWGQILRGRDPQCPALFRAQGRQRQCHRG
jgi:filamentous hemagglutinin